MVTVVKIVTWLGEILIFNKSVSEVMSLNGFPLHGPV